MRQIGHCPRHSLAFGARKLAAPLRALHAGLLIYTALLLGCAHAAPPAQSGPTMELALDDNHASERPLTPPRTFEILMRMAPELPAYIPLRIRFLLAQAGHIVITFYKTSPEGNPGEELMRLDRVYDPSFISTGKDGRWVVEELAISPQHAPLWIGIHSSAGARDNDPRLWASSNDSGWVFQRDADPSLPLYSGKIARTPMLRLTVAPAQ